MYVGYSLLLSKVALESSQVAEPGSVAQLLPVPLDEGEGEVRETNVQEGPSEVLHVQVCNACSNQACTSQKDCRVVSDHMPGSLLAQALANVLQTHVRSASEVIECMRFS